MPLLLLAICALILAATAALIVVTIVLVGWVRQDRVLRSMQRAIAERTNSSRSTSVEQ